MLLGRGADAICYRIPKTNYILRIPGYRELIDTTQNIDFNITKQDRVNHIVGKIDNCEIMKYLDGFSPNDLLSLDERATSSYIRRLYPTISELEVKHYIEKKEKARKLLNECMPKISKYNIKKYYSQILKAQKRGCLHDYGGANSIFNPQKGTLTAIDFSDYSYEGQGPQPMYINDAFISFLHQVGLKNILCEQDQNGIVKKSVCSLLEFITEHKFPLCEVKLDFIRAIFASELKDKEFAEEIIHVLDKFNKNKSFDNVMKLKQYVENL